MRIIIDGYNMMHAVTLWRKNAERELRQGRESLEAWCRLLRQRRKDIRQLTIVFDGASPPCEFYDTEETGGVETVYTHAGEDADDRIIDLLEPLNKRSDVWVISKDNYVSNNARAYGARVMPPEDFFAWGEARLKGVKESRNPSEKKMTRAAADEITAEYKRMLGIE